MNLTLLLLILLYISFLLIIIINYFKGNKYIFIKKKEFQEAQLIYNRINDELGTMYDDETVDRFYQFLIKPLAQKFSNEIQITDNPNFNKLKHLLKDQPDENKIDHYLELIRLIIDCMNKKDFKNLDNIMYHEKYLSLCNSHKKTIDEIIHVFKKNQVNYDTYITRQQDSSLEIAEIKTIIDLLSKSIRTGKAPCDFNYELIDEQTRKQINEVSSYIKKFITVDLTYLNSVNAALKR